MRHSILDKVCVAKGDYFLQTLIDGHVDSDQFLRKKHRKVGRINLITFQCNCFSSYIPWAVGPSFISSVYTMRIR